VTLQEWTQSIIDELTAAGFEATTYQGFPLAPMPTTQQEGVRFLKFHTTLAADRRIYAEGCLFVPAGSWREADSRAAKEGKIL
jgi:hypothetical protein